jgi:hypothetical protein
MAANPAFIGTPRLTFASLSSANTNLDGTGTITSLITGAATGTRVLEINMQCSATSAAALVNIFLSTDSGSNWVLFDQIAVTAATVNNTTRANRNIATYTNLILPNANFSIGVTTTIAQATRVWAMGGDF